MKNLSNAWKTSATLMTIATLLLFMGGGAGAKEVHYSTATSSIALPTDGGPTLNNYLDADPCWACFMACGYMCHAPGIYCGFVADCDSPSEVCKCKCERCVGGTTALL